MRVHQSKRCRALITVLACFVVTTAANARERIYVLSQAGAALSEIDDGANTVATPIALDKGPAALALASDASRAYVTHPDLGKVSIVDLRERKVARSVAVPGSPFGIAIAKDGRLFVGDWNGAHVSVLDADGKISNRIDVGRAPAHLVLTPDESLLFVANRESDSVSVVRTGNLSVVATIPVGRAPFAIALSPDAARLYVANVQSGTVSIIDTAKFEVIETSHSGAMPYGAAVTPDGLRVLITNQQAGTVSVLGRDTGETRSIKVGEYPEGVAINAAGTRAYVANWFSDSVSVIDLTNFSEFARIKCAGGPRGLVISQGSP